MRDMRLVRGAAAAALLASTACTPLDDAMVAIFGRSMRDQPSFDPYEMTLLPAENAVPFAAGNYPAEMGRLNIGQPEAFEYDVPDFTQAAMIPPGAPVVRDLPNPVAPDEASLARGQQLYERTCIVCHGPEGLGAGAFIVDRWPALQVYDVAGPQAASYSDGYIYGMIRVGRGLMPAYGHQITHFDRWHVVNYVRQLQQRNAGAGAGAPQAQPAQADTAAGGEG